MISKWYSWWILQYPFFCVSVLEARRSFSWCRTLCFLLINHYPALPFAFGAGFRSLLVPTRWNLSGKVPLYSACRMSACFGDSHFLLGWRGALVLGFCCLVVFLSGCTWILVYDYLSINVRLIWVPLFFFFESILFPVSSFFCWYFSPPFFLSLLSAFFSSLHCSYFFCSCLFSSTQNVV